MTEEDARALYERDMRDGCSPSWEELNETTKNAYRRHAPRSRRSSGLGGRFGKLHWEPLGRPPLTPEQLA